MSEEEDNEAVNRAIAERWCTQKGSAWRVLDTAGRGGTAPVFTVASPDGPKALKILDRKYSEGAKGEESEKRVKKQVDALGEHDCPYLVQIYDGGRFEDRFFILMNKAKGTELEKCLDVVPRDKIAKIIHQIATACIFLRKKGLCHRDLKSANIFVTDDFEHSTLLDVSVAREINDPVGLGTDEGGQLPVVATSRYSPPEYLFRLIDPSPKLWHALDIYQLGGLIHDLVMRQPMFEDEYKKSSENRYRFAWIVATQAPPLFGAEVETGLILLGRRALDKNWERRATISLEDFLVDARSQRKLGLSAMGFAKKEREKPDPTATVRQTLIKYAKAVEEGVRIYQVDNGVTAEHEIKSGSHDLEKDVVFSWKIDPDTNGIGYEKFVLKFSISVGDQGGDPHFDLTASLSAVVQGDKTQMVDLLFPNIALSDAAESKIVGNAVASLGELGAKLMRLGG